MTYYLIIRGPLGIGKSTVARTIAKELKADYISLDDVLSENGLDKVGLGQESIPATNFIMANGIILPRARESLTQKKILVLDGNFYHQAQISDLVTNIQFPYFAFTLKAPLETCIARDRSRKRSYGEDAAQAVHNLVSRFEYGTSIDTDGRNADEVVREIISCLPK